MEKTDSGTDYGGSRQGYPPLGGHDGPAVGHWSHPPYHQPQRGGVTPNWTIAMYSITISLTRPGLTRALGIGFVAGLTLIPSSKSAFPLGNIASELCGAMTACILVKAFALAHLEQLKVKPFIVGFLATTVSGSVFTYILKLVLGLPLAVWTRAMLPVVLTVGVLNGVVTQVLYGPVRKIFFATEGKRHE